MGRLNNNPNYSSFGHSVMESLVGPGVAGSPREGLHHTETETMMACRLLF